MQKERSVLEVYPYFVLLPEKTIILLSFPFIKVFCRTGQAGNRLLLQISAELDKYGRGMTAEWLLQRLEFVS